MANFDMTMNLSLSKDERETIQHVSDETTRAITVILRYWVSPSIGIIGVIFNIFSIIVLFKHGLHKCSNILLFSLAFMDISSLIGFNNIPNLLYSVHGGGRFLYSESESFLLYTLYFVSVIMDYGLGLAALCVPMLITIERLVAVFLPLKVGQIITPLRTWIAIGGNATFWIATMTYTCFWYKFEYVFDHSLNKSVGLIARSETFYADLRAIPIFIELFFSMKIPPLITVVGCVAIIVKIKVTTRKRSKMTSSKVASTSKTTQTLLAVCFAYLFVCVILAVPSYLPAHLSAYSLTTDNPTNMATIIYFTMGVMYSCNCSWNFLAYVALNKNFRDTFKAIVIPKHCKKLRQ